MAVSWPHARLPHVQLATNQGRKSRLCGAKFVNKRYYTYVG